MLEEEKTITLRKPVTIGDITYDKLDLREPLSGELAKAQREPTSTDFAISLVNQIAKIPRKVAEQLCARDIQEVSNFFGSFSSAGEEEAGKN